MKKGLVHIKSDPMNHTHANDVCGGLNLWLRVHYVHNYFVYSVIATTKQSKTMDGISFQSLLNMLNSISLSHCVWAHFIEHGIQLNSAREMENTLGVWLKKLDKLLYNIPLHACTHVRLPFLFLFKYKFQMKIKFKLWIH